MCPLRRLWKWWSSSHITVLPDPVVQGVAYAAPAEYNAPASTMAYQVHAAPVDEYDAPAARAAPSLLVDVPVVQVVQVPQVQVVEKTIEIPQLQTIEEIVAIPEIQTPEHREFGDCSSSRNGACGANPSHSSG